jgi:hypothetical protein
MNDDFWSQFASFAERLYDDHHDAHERGECFEDCLICEELREKKRDDRLAEREAREKEFLERRELERYEK